MATQASLQAEAYTQAEKAYIAAMSKSLIDEIFKTLGLKKQGWLRKIGDRLFAAPTSRLGALALEVEQRTRQSSINEAFRWAVELFSHPLDIRGAEHIPLEGPLLITANHPGTIDSLAVFSATPRADIKAIAGLNPIFNQVKSLHPHLIFATHDTHQRMTVVRQGIRHLRDGGCLLIFPAGNVEPDPAVLPGAVDSLASWQRSVEIFLKRVPQTTLLPVAVSHILLPKFAHHFLARLRRTPNDARRTAEMLQIVSQIRAPGKDRLSVRLSFGLPRHYEEWLQHPERGAPFEQLLKAMQELFEQHVATFDAPHPPLSTQEA